MTVDLKVLADHCKDLLLAEVAGWLHDMGKCADEHIINQASDKPENYSYRYKTAQSHRLPPSLPDVRLMNEAISVKDLIEQGMPRVISDASKPWLLRVLGRCHSAAHVEKELSDRETSTKQPQNNTRLSTAFGLEGNPITGLTNILSGLPFNSMQNRATFIPQVEKAFDAALGDTRRPINEVTLADWSGTVAALYKSALAGALLGVKPDNPDNLRWRLLCVNFDVLGLYAKAVRIGDLLGYQRVVDEACEAVKKLVEEEYPLGNEIYRDSTGIYFTFPDLDLPANLAQEIRHRVEEVAMELAPHIVVTVGDGNTAIEQLKGILGKARKKALEALAQPFDSQNLSACWQQQWTTVGAGNWELCPVCRLRPKHEDDEVCRTCEDRRIKRIQDWLEHLDQTIWLDEVADISGFLALIVGNFGLDDWLSGELVQTMLVRAEPGKPNECVPKNPSPARLRRIWETTQRFWKTAFEEKWVKNVVPQVPFRFIVVPRNALNSLKPHHTYDLIVKERRLSVVWDGERLITCDNLDYFKKLIGEDLQQALAPGSSFDLYTPAGYGQRSQKITSIVVGRLELLEKPYFPTLILLAEPRTFMALVPADKALEVVKAIKARYETEMGKVRNRLPLTLGVVYFGRRIPLAAALDAGRRMIHHPVREIRAEVKKLDPPVVTDTTWPVAREVTLRIGEREITLTVPTVMGDNQTQDVWYPYWQVTGQPTGRTRWFVGPNGEHWVHVCELQKGDRVAFTPSTFDYEYLDTTSRRFEVIYDANGQRRSPEKRQRPYLLEELDGLEKAWGEISRLSKSQIHAIIPAIETKRQVWEKTVGEEALALPEGDVFRQFVCDTLREAKVHSELLEHAALSGILRDATEIHLEIMKEEVR